MEKYELTLARSEDFDRALEILRSGRDFQRQQGFVQWDDSFPNPETIRSDIREKLGYVVKVDGKIAAYLYLGFDGDPSYPAIRGKWKSDEPYAVVHRIAIAPEFRGMGLASVTFRLTEDYCKSRGFYSLRIDTHESNKRMQHILTKNGFLYCGIVLQNGSDRLAYEKKI
ncbi:MAG: GNAT family N-acetyltransferase [Ruminococcaceae bacterium]|nr:GNAT family N-acetyltransferase [Oscillospiraceae bacterium]